MSHRESGAALNGQIYEEASDWFIDMRAGDVDAAGRQRFNAWIRKSPEHLRAYLELSEIWDDAPQVDPDRKLATAVLIDRARERQDVIFLPGTPGSSLPSAVAPSLGKLRGRFMGRSRLSIAAAVLLVCTLVTLIAFQLSRVSIYSTGLDEQRTMTLADGSRVEMNSRTRLRVRFTATQRAIDLLEGQALFRVVKNAKQPFIVKADSAWVRAVGTEFDVYKKSGGVVVTVLEGRVAVSSGADSSTPNSTLVSTGEQLTVASGGLPRPTRANTAAATAWTHGLLIFDGSRLADVAEEFNRYNQRPLIVRDPALVDFRISGVYTTTDPALLLQFLREQPGIRIRETAAAIEIRAQ